MRHAYLILAHTCPGQLATLIGLLDHEDNDIFVHIDAKFKDFDERNFYNICKRSRLQFIKPRIKVNWGGVSIMRAELSLLKAAVPGKYDYYHLLSGMDLPIKSQKVIHAFFNEHPGKQFLHLWTMKQSARNRFRYFTVFPEGGGNFLTNFINNMVKGILIAFKCRINKDVDFHLASQWFSISNGFAEYLVGQEEWLEKTFRHTNTCDEVFLATALMNSPFKNSVYDPTEYPENQSHDNMANLRFIDWTRGKSIRHPWTFTIGDYELLKGMPHFWARKFDERVDAEIIEKISSMIKPVSAERRR